MDVLWKVLSSKVLEHNELLLLFLHLLSRSQPSSHLFPSIALPLSSSYNNSGDLTKQFQLVLLSSGSVSDPNNSYRQKLLSYLTTPSPTISTDLFLRHFWSKACKKWERILDKIIHLVWGSCICIWFLSCHHHSCESLESKKQHRFIPVHRQSSAYKTVSSELKAITQGGYDLGRRTLEVCQFSSNQRASKVTYTHGRNTEHKTSLSELLQLHFKSQMVLGPDLFSAKLQNWKILLKWDCLNILGTWQRYIGCEEIYKTETARVWIGIYNAQARQQQTKHTWSN